MYPYCKRLLDILAALTCGVLLLPLLLILIVLIRLDSPGRAVFTQKRVGRGKRTFLLYKFRTMRIDTPHDVPTHLLADPQRYITRAGRFLRKTSLDELPQLWNVLIGDMSFVGPRPALWNQFDLVAERDRYPGRGGRTPNDVRPGLTGWAQVNGRDELEIHEKARLDGEYVKNMSLIFDLVCALRTLRTVARAEGVREGGTGAKGDAR